MYVFVKHGFCNWCRGLEKPIISSAGFISLRTQLSQPCIHVSNQLFGSCAWKGWRQGKFFCDSSKAGWKKRSIDVAIHPRVQNNSTKRKGNSVCITPFKKMQFRVLSSQTKTETTSKITPKSLNKAVSTLPSHCDVHTTHTQVERKQKVAPCFNTLVKINMKIMLG